MDTDLDLETYKHIVWILDTWNGPEYAQEDDDEVSLLDQHTRRLYSSSLSY